MAGNGTTDCTTSAIWTSWTTATSSTTTSSSDRVWSNWVTSTASTANPNITYGVLDAAQRPVVRKFDVSPEMQQKIDDERKRLEKLRLEEEKRRKEADIRAEELLLSMLDSSQIEDYRKNQSFYVNTRNAKYLIRKGRSYNVDVYSVISGKKEETLCVVPTINVPLADQMLAQMLHISTDEQSFNRIANHQKS